jgi:hypothetical protein
MDRVTLVGNRAANSYALLATGVGAATTTLTARHLAAGGFGRTLLRGAYASGSTVNVAVDYSNLDGSPSQIDPAGSFTAAGSTTFSNNRAGDPRFVNSAAADYRLGDGSPAIDIGGADLLPGPADDLGGSPRPRDGDQNGVADDDAGAFEYQPPPPPAAVRAPVISSLTQSAKKWREPKKPGLATETRKKKVPVGTTFSYSLDKPATVTLSFTRTQPGRKVARKCVPPKKANKKKHRCKRTIVAGTLTVTGHTGVNRIHFQGRTSATKKLKPGKYTATISATTTLGLTSTPKTLTFTIVK